MTTTTKTTEATPTEVAPTKALNRDDAIKKAYSTATAELREQHKDEFNQLRVKHTEALGYEWTPGPTAEEKAADEIEKLIAANPGLAALYQKVAVQEG